MSNTVWTSFNRFEVGITQEAIDDIAVGGREADYWVELHRDSVDLSSVTDAALRDELREYGAWDEEELADRNANEQRIIWLAAWQAAEEEVE